MIKMTHVKLEEPIVFGEGVVRLLVIESPKEFFSIVSELSSQLNGSEGDFCFWEEEKCLSAAKKGAMVTDLFSLEINDKKVTGLLYKNLENLFSRGELAEDFASRLSQEEMFMEKLSFLSPIPIEYDAPSFSDILKVHSVRVRDEGDTLLEKVVTYVTALAALKDIAFIVFVNLKSVLTDKELQSFYAHCENEKIALLLIESSLSRPIGEKEEATVITSDLCEIICKKTTITV
ncbi:MAG: type II-A CRISPR-associated protein Csn2 [Clostridia bacterium]|nr:type II-A CRISPR-associated protein Csn2 [Clostridia bacterium]